MKLAKWLMLFVILMMATSMAHAETLVFTWQQPMCDDLAGWELDLSLNGTDWKDEEDLIQILFVSEKTIYTHNETLIFGPGGKIILYARLRAVDEAGNHSVWSNVATGEIDVQPHAPQEFEFRIEIEE